MLVSKRRYDCVEGPASPTSANNPPSSFAASSSTAASLASCSLEYQSSNVMAMNSGSNNSSNNNSSSSSSSNDMQSSPFSSPFRSALLHQHQHHSPSAPASPSHTHKKVRAEDSLVETSPASTMFSTLQLAARRRNYESAFQSSSPAEPVEKYIPSPLIKRIRGANTINGDPTLMRGNSNGGDESGEDEKTPIFTLAQVKAIVARAVEDRENHIRAEYDVILQQKLMEQYQNFTKFNEDYINRQLRESPWNYMS